MKNETPRLTVPSRPSLRKHAFYVILALVSLFGLGMTQSARANFIATMNQVGTDVVVTGSGTFDFTNLTSAGTGPGYGGLLPSTAQFGIGFPNGENCTGYQGISGPTSFGVSGVFTSADSGSGDKVMLLGSPHIMVVPLGYMSGNLLSDTSTYNNKTFAMLGINPGTYTWSWGTGDHADSFTIQVGPAGVPDTGTTFSLLGLASLGLVALRRKLRC